MMDEIKDDELDELMSKKETTITETTKRPVAESEFGHKFEDVKVAVLEEAKANDEAFVTTVKSNLKSAAVKLSEVEQKKADYQKQQVDAESEVLDRSQKQNEHGIKEDAWSNKQKCRQFHYNGVKPIMMFVGITEPMNLIMLYFLTIVLTPFFLVAKFFRGTIGALLCGACDSNRPKAMKGFIWTVLAMLLVAVVAAAVYLFLKWQHII